jgi:hypothetical protein
MMSNENKLSAEFLEMLLAECKLLSDDIGRMLTRMDGNFCDTIGLEENAFQNGAMPNPIHDPRYKIFREMLTEARKEKGLLESDIDEKLGKNQPYVSKYERGERRLDLPEFLDVADALGINPAQFIEKYRQALAQNR